MYDDNWAFRPCPRCTSHDAKRAIRGHATSFTCLTCRHEWDVRRMPSDAEAMDIFNRVRKNDGDDIVPTDPTP
jgi:hypothetical protein